MTEHTKEPWIAGDYYIAHPDFGHIVRHVAIPEDARRIVACVNACAGLSTERLEEIVKHGQVHRLRGLRDAAAMAADEEYATLSDAKLRGEGS